MSVSYNLIIFCFLYSGINAEPLPEETPFKEQKIAITPFMATNLTVLKALKCDSQSKVVSILLNRTIPSLEFTCNGYRGWITKGIYPAKLAKGSVEDLTIAELKIQMNYLNGNIYEILDGKISEGTCKGDIFYSVNQYIADDQLGCSGKGLHKLSIGYIYQTIIGPKCGSICKVDDGIEGYLKFNPSLTDSGL